MKSVIRRSLQASACLAVAVFCVAAQANLIQYDHVYEFSNPDPDPAGPQPWQTTTIDDGGTPGTVTVTLDNLNLVDVEYVKEWYMNVVEAWEPELSLLSFSVSSKTGAFNDPTFNASVDTYMADGDGKFDIMYMFDTANTGSTSRFGAGETLVITIDDSLTGMAGTLVASDFDALSAPSGGHGPFPVATHVLGINGEYSGWLSVPEPGTLALLGLGGLALLRTRRRS